MSKEGGKWNVRQPPLHTACHNGNLEIVKVLVQGGQANVDKGGGRSNKTSLHRACSMGHKLIVEYLIMEAKCDVGECVCLLPYMYC